MERAIITVRGRVQKVGYRDFVAQIANKMGISGTVQNLPDGKSVKIIAEAEKKILEGFINALWAKEDNVIKVINIDVDYEPSKGEYEFFDIIYDGVQKENFERIGEAVIFLKSLDSGQKVMINKQDRMIEKLDDARVEIAGEIREMRSDIKSYMDRRFMKIEDEIAGIKMKIGMS